MRFTADGAPNAETQTEDPAMILASMRHRIRTLGGSVQITRTEVGAPVLTVSMPLSEVISKYRTKY
jgi:signal transduction histidine kinase